MEQWKWVKLDEQYVLMYNFYFLSLGFEESAKNSFVNFLKSFKFNGKEQENDDFSADFFSLEGNKFINLKSNYHFITVLIPENHFKDLVKLTEKGGDIEES